MNIPGAKEPNTINTLIKSKNGDQTIVVCQDVLRDRDGAVVDVVHSIAIQCPHKEMRFQFESGRQALELIEALESFQIQIQTIEAIEPTKDFIV